MVNRATPYFTVNSRPIRVGNNGVFYYTLRSTGNRKYPLTNLHRYYTKPSNRLHNLNNIGTIANLKRSGEYSQPTIPPTRVSPPRRTSPVLMNTMINQIYRGGRRSNINASRYSNAERVVLVRLMTEKIKSLRDRRDAKKAEAAEARSLLKTSSGNTATLKKKITNADERVGYYDDAVRAYTRGLRAVKPLTGIVSPRVRARSATPNRFSPAPPNVNENAIYMPLNRPHLVVKTPGVGVIYLNPNTFRGFIKNAARVNISEANVRNWLRMARRNFPNEPLFRHPLATAKNVTAGHIRFSRT